MTQRGLRSWLVATLLTALGLGLVLLCGFVWLRPHARAAGMVAAAGGLSQGAVTGLLVGGAAAFWLVFRLLLRRR